MTRPRYGPTSTHDPRLTLPWRYRKHLHGGGFRIALAVRGSGCRLRYGQR